VTGKLLDLSLAPGGEGMGGEGAEAWMGGGGEKIFLLNKLVMMCALKAKSSRKLI
jgi:20S proteasome subunit alpha 3